MPLRDEDGLIYGDGTGFIFQACSMSSWRFVGEKLPNTGSSRTAALPLRAGALCQNVQ